MSTLTIGGGLKGLAITPPIIGRISIGRMVEKDGKRLPEKDDQFTVTTQIQDRDGWRLHPLDESLRQQAGGKLRSLPIRLLFNDPALNMRSAYTMFDRKTGRPVCTGDGEHCLRSTMEGVKSLPCPRPELCELAKSGACKPYARLNVLLSEDDAAGTFVFRTTSFNSIRTLTARMAYYAAASGGLLACLPLELRLRGKSTVQSFGMPIYYVDLVIRNGLTLEQAIGQAREMRDLRRAAGFDQGRLDEAARAGFQQGAFEESEEEGSAVMSEFFPAEAGGTASPSPEHVTRTHNRSARAATRLPSTLPKNDSEPPRSTDVPSPHA